MAFAALFFDAATGKLRDPERIAEGFHACGEHMAALAYATVVQLAAAYRAIGGRALMVGGSVRDMVLGIVPKDIDIEVYGVPPERVEEVVRGFGDVSDVGKAFAILKLVVNGIDIDVAMPRKEQKTGGGHRGFTIETDPFLDPRRAARRRDFTVNAIAADPLTGELVDPFNGMGDLGERTLRVVDAATFAEDPLRVLRAMQLVARFHLRVDSESFALMHGMIAALREIAPERIGEEWRKLLLQSDMPSLGLRFGMDVGAFSVLHPELPPLADTPQEPEWHPEGDVWVHTMMVVDEAATIVRRERLDDERALVVLFGALCHDFGKPAVTCREEGRIRSHGHEEAGVAPTRSFLTALSLHYRVIDQVVGIVRDHMKPYRLWHADVVDGKTVKDGALRRLAARIQPAMFCDLVLVTEADYCGRGPFPDPEHPGKTVWPADYQAGRWLLDRGRALELLGGPAAHVVKGDELIDLGYSPNPLFGQLIALCDDLRDEKELCHYNLLDILREVPPDAYGERDAKKAIELLKLELD